MESRDGHGDPYELADRIKRWPIVRTPDGKLARESARKLRTVYTCSIIIHASDFRPLVYLPRGPYGTQSDRTGKFYGTTRRILLYLLYFAGRSDGKVLRGIFDRFTEKIGIIFLRKIAARGRPGPTFAN